MHFNEDSRLKFIISTKKYITELGMKCSNAKLFPENSLLMAIYGATAWKVSSLKFRATTSKAICAIIPNSKEYTYLLKFKLETKYKYLINLSTGSARDILSQDKISNIQILNPYGDVLRKFNLYVDGLYEKCYNFAKQFQESASLEDWLLPMLMNGHVTVARALPSSGEAIGYGNREGLNMERRDMHGKH